MIAHLGMYDMPALRPANDLLWTAIRDHLGYGPATLTRDMDPWDIWQSPDLLFSQTCGMPYRTRLHGKTRLIGTPNYGLQGLKAGHYMSVIVARKEAQGNQLADFQNARFAYNEALSQSGWAAPIALALAQGVRFESHIPTGSHVLSVKAVANGSADLAGIDALTWALLTRYDDATVKLKVIGQTPATPTLPYITGPTQDADEIAQAVQAAIRDVPTETRAALHLQGLVQIPAADYLAVPTPPAPDELKAGSVH